jgi:LysM repeat protein
MEENRNGSDRKVKFLTVVLSISLAFNLALVINFAFIAYEQFRPVKESLIEKAPLALESKNVSFESIIDQYMSKSMTQLTQDLKDSTQVQEGYKVRDLALSFLVNFHYLNLEKALSGIDVQRRVARFEKKGSGEQFELWLYPGLQDTHFKAVETFIASEKWPITAEGLFYEIKKGSWEKNQTLKQAFFQTKEFDAFSLLFKRNNLHISCDELLKLLAVNDYNYIEKFAKTLLKTGDFSYLQLQQFLKQSIHLGSNFAATCLIELSPEYVIKNIEDQELAIILKNLTAKTEKTLYVLKELVSSIRQDALRKEAALRLYVLYSDVLSKEVVSLDKIKKKQVELPLVEKPKNNKYVVKEGDTLWKIAKANQLTVEKLAELNAIDRKKILKVGRTLVVSE